MSMKKKEEKLREMPCHSASCAVKDDMRPAGLAQLHSSGEEPGSHEEHKLPWATVREADSMQAFHGKCDLD